MTSALHVRKATHGLRESNFEVTSGPGRGRTIDSMRGCSSARSSTESSRARQGRQRCADRSAGKRRNALRKTRLSGAAWAFASRRRINLHSVTGASI